VTIVVKSSIVNSLAHHSCDPEGWQGFWFLGSAVSPFDDMHYHCAESKLPFLLFFHPPLRLLRSACVARNSRFSTNHWSPLSEPTASLTPHLACFLFAFLFSPLFLCFKFDSDCLESGLSFFRPALPLHLLTFVFYNQLYSFSPWRSLFIFFTHLPKERLLFPTHNLVYPAFLILDLVFLSSDSRLRGYFGRFSSGSPHFSCQPGPF